MQNKITIIIINTTKNVFDDVINNTILMWRFVFFNVAYIISTKLLYSLNITLFYAATFITGSNESKKISKQA